MNRQEGLAGHVFVAPCFCRKLGKYCESPPTKEIEKCFISLLKPGFVTSRPKKLRP